MNEDPRLGLVLEAERSRRNVELEFWHGRATRQDVQIEEFKVEADANQAHELGVPWKVINEALTR